MSARSTKEQTRRNKEILASGLIDIVLEGPQFAQFPEELEILKQYKEKKGKPGKAIQACHKILKALKAEGKK